MIIYKLQLREDGRIYIGQTVQDIKVRIRKHIRENRTHFELAVTKYGIDAFDLEIIDTATTKEELDEKEKFWIKHYDCMYPKGFNMCEGGSTNSGYKHSEEMKKLLSEKKKEYYRNGGKHPMKGKHHSEESRRKNSESTKGKYCGEKHPNYGKHWSDEQKLKMSLAKRGENHPNWGKHLSEETREKIRQANIGANNHSARKTMCVETGQVFDTITEAAKSIGKTPEAIYACCKGKCHTAGGYHWRYID